MSFESKPMQRNARTYSFGGFSWRWVKVLGKGSFGEAILVERIEGDVSTIRQQQQTGPCGLNNPLPRLAVVKSISTSSMTSAEKRDAQKEIDMLSRLRHVSIVAFYGSEIREDELLLFMEYCNGGDLERLVKRQKGVYFSEEDVASLFVQAASALRYLHERRILHRDVKSQNFFLTLTSQDKVVESCSGVLPRIIVKLGDFGISTTLKNTMALAKTICGTPYYFSPELCLNRPYNSKSDVWSLGVVLYEMACLKYPFDSNSMKGLMQRILQGQWAAPLPPHYSPQMTSLLEGMLEQKVTKRFDISKVMASPFVRHHAERIQHAYHALQINKGSTREGKGGTDLNAIVRVPRDALVADPRSLAGDENRPNMHVRGNLVVANTNGPCPSPPKPPTAATPSGRIGGDLESRQQRAMLRRIELEKQTKEKRQALEELRQRKNIKAAQHFDFVREQRERAERMRELERLDDVRRRIEMCSWDDQQEYIEEGWRVVQDTRERQADRGKWRVDTEEQLEAIKHQMAIVEAKMEARRRERQKDGVEDLPLQLITPENRLKNSPPLPVYANVPPPPPTARELAQAFKNRVSADAPWNRDRPRGVPVGFTKESWERQLELERIASGQPKSIAVADVTRPTTTLSSPTPSDPTKPNKISAKVRTVEALDVDAFLENELSRNPAVLEAEVHRRKEELLLGIGVSEWEKHLKRIREANSASSEPSNQNIPQDEPACTEHANNKPLPPSRRAPRPQEFIPVSDLIRVVEDTTRDAHDHPDVCVEDLRGDSSYSYADVLASLASPHPTAVAYDGFETSLAFGDEGWADESGAEENDKKCNRKTPPPQLQQHEFREGEGGRVVPKLRIEKKRHTNNAASAAAKVGGGDMLVSDRVGVQELTLVDDCLALDNESKGKEGEEILRIEDNASAPHLLVDVFFLDGRELVLPGVTETSTRKERVAALSRFLADALGGPRSLARLREQLEAIQLCDADESTAQKMLEDIQRRYGPQGSYVDLTMQLMVAEGMLW